MKDFSREEIDYILDIAEKLEPVARGKKGPGFLTEKSFLFFFLNQVQEHDSLLRLPPGGWGGRS